MARAHRFSSPINWISLSLSFNHKQASLPYQLINHTSRLPFICENKNPCFHSIHRDLSFWIRSCFLLEMENKRQLGSLPSELFGNKEPHTSDVFASIFAPSKGVEKNSTGSEMTGSWQQHSSGSTRRDDADKNGQLPCHMSSSLYYGGRESYSHSKTSNASGSYTAFNKDAGEDDPTGASRGNWWQGSLYY